MSFDWYTYKKNFDKDNYKNYSFRLKRKNVDEERVINYLDSIKNKRDYFYKLVTDDMKRKNIK